MTLKSYLISAFAALLHTSSAAKQCSPASFPGISIPNDAKIVHLSALPATNISVPSSTASSTPNSVSLCNVTVTYTHPEWNDTIHTTIYLPLEEWNGRFQAVGGTGWAATTGGDSLLSAVANGYSAGNTDAGHDLNGFSTASWWRTAQGQLNIPLLEDFASIALNDIGVIGKQVSRLFYGHEPNYSYWNGCSTGGRQGYMMAQRYPKTFDGILAGSPAINWDRFIVAEYWPQYVMNSLNHHPSPCTFDALTAAVVDACDKLDGVQDGLIAALSRCHFDPLTVVNTTSNCNGTQVTISKLDAEVIKSIWAGPHSSDSKSLWYGLNLGEPLEGLADTNCTLTKDCTGVPFEITTDYITRWVLQNANFDLSKIDLQKFTDIYHSSTAQYQEIIGTSDSDLSDFKEAGGKLVSWHGLADQLIFPQGTANYFSRVEAWDSSVRDFFRYFEAPGVRHCGGGQGEVPNDPFDAVVAWVETGTAPEILPATSTDGKRTRDLCLYPIVSVFKGGDPADAGSFACQAHW